MAISLVRASTQGLVNTSPPVLTLPFSFGLWVYMASVSAASNTVFGQTAAGAGHYNRLAIQSNERFTAGSAAGGAVAAASLTTTLTAGNWSYVVCRFVSDADRWCSALYSTGATEHVQNTTSRTPTVTKLDIGTLDGTLPMDGSIAELWYSDSDIQDGGGQLNDATLRQLAYGGPFSVPRIAPMVAEYRSFRKHSTSDGDEVGEVYCRGERQTWTNTNGVTIGPHPPLPYWYEKPGQNRRVLTI